MYISNDDDFFFTCCHVNLGDDRLAFRCNFVLAAPLRVRKSLCSTPVRRRRITFVRPCRGMTLSADKGLDPFALCALPAEDGMEGNKKRV